MRVLLIKKISSLISVSPVMSNPDNCAITKRLILIKGLIVNFLIVIFSITAFQSCNSVEPPTGLTINLKLEDVSCTEAWITLSSNLRLPAAIELKQNNQAISIINLDQSDSLLFIDSLLPNTSYTFQASNNAYRVLSNQLQVNTLDTTSHNFTRQSWTFGEHSSSVLYDVAIIDENNIWAVGEIYINDSLGQPDPARYNAAIWNGQNWAIQRIPYYYQGQPFYHSIQSVFAFGSNDIWFCGNGVVHWDGDSFIPIPIPTNVWGPYQMNKLWGTSSEDLYIVGNEGNIAYYSGPSSGWQKIESGTDVDIQDIWGVTDNNANTFILCAASNAVEPGEHKILRINNSYSVDSISWISNRRVNSVWMESKFQLFACGDGMFIRSNADLWVQQDELTPVFKERIRGNSKNDLFVVGVFGLLAHYNGVDWREYPEASAALVYTSLDFKNNLMVTVGYTQTKAVIQFMIHN